MAGVVIEVSLDPVGYAMMQSLFDRPHEFGGDDDLGHGTEVGLC